MKRSYSGSFLVIALSACLVPLALLEAASAAEPTPRDIVRKYIKEGDGKGLGQLIGFTKEVEHVVALDYAVLVRTDGEEKEVDPNEHQFEIGDQIRVRIQPVKDAYIYIFYHGASGEKKCLLPEVGRGEVAPLVKGGAEVRLPEDGHLELVAPPGRDELIVAATEAPVSDLAGLANVVFKKPDEELTPEEKEIKKGLIASVNKALESIRARQGSKYRGLLTEDAMEEYSCKVRQTGKTRALLEEPPHEGSGSTFVMAASTVRGDRPNLLVTISLTSVAPPEGKP
jgi:hypothetical protein